MTCNNSYVLSSFKRFSGITDASIGLINSRQIKYDNGCLYIVYPRFQLTSHFVDFLKSFS